MTTLVTPVADSSITTVGFDYFGSPIYLGETLFAISRKDKRGVAAVTVQQQQGRILLQLTGTSVLIEIGSCILIKPPYRIQIGRCYYPAPSRGHKEMMSYLALDSMNNELENGNLVLTQLSKGLKLGFVENAGDMFISTYGKSGHIYGVESVRARSVFKLAKPKSFDGVPGSWLSEIEAAHFKNESDTVLYSDLFPGETT